VVCGSTAKPRPLIGETSCPRIMQLPKTLPGRFLRLATGFYRIGANRRLPTFN